MKVLQIHYKDTLSLRSQMLRNGAPDEECQFMGDSDEQTFHLGAFVENRLVSVASFYYEKNGYLEDPHQYRLRGMATHPDFQRQGHSQSLLRTAFPLIKQNFCTLIWCNARESAQGFYVKLGFNQIGHVFDIPGIGPHILMFRKVE